MKNIYAKIVATGRYIPPDATNNKQFLANEFYTKEGIKIELPNEEIIAKFKAITGIEDRRYIIDKSVNSEMPVLATMDACFFSRATTDDLDVIIVAHNFGDITKGEKVTWDSVPSQAAKVKHKLGIKNPGVVAYDLIYDKGFLKIKNLLGLEKADLTIHTNDHENGDLHQEAEFSIIDACVDKENLSSIIVADYLGDEKCMATKLKESLQIRNPNIITFDILFGCPGWLQGMILANNIIKAGKAKRIMVVGTETLSRVCDPHDRDSMIYADGAGLAILEATESDEPIGIIHSISRSDTLEHVHLLTMGKSNNPSHSSDELFLKMEGNEVYEYALSYVPLAIKELLDQTGISVDKVTKLLIHQANAKMDEKILQRLFSLYGKKRSDIPSGFMPMTIEKYGNSSVATVPTLLDLLLKKELEGHEVHSGEVIVFASVGAGMNINAMVYKMP